MAKRSADKLKPVERKILRILQTDGRISNVELASKVGLSATACWNHTQRLYASGVIKAVRAIIDPAAVDQSMPAIIGVVLDRSTPESFEIFETAVRALPQMLECCLVAGDVDYFLYVRVRDIADFHRLHSKEIIALPGVRQVRTFFVLKEVKTDGLLTI
jgi:Lrp/AsnC family transcriptional regulator, leucine-responsive regulatory protein